MQENQARLEEKNKTLLEEALKLREKVASLTNTVSRVKMSEQMKSQFMAKMCHEVRSPIGNIINMVNLFKIYFYDTKEGIDINQCFEIIEMSSSRLSKTLDSILNLSAMENNSCPVKFEELKVTSDIMEPVIKELHYSASLKDLDLLLEDNTDNSKLISDKYMLSQIMVNLVDNAIKYTASGLVKVKLRLIGPFLIVEVIDTGTGIKKESVDKLFNPYFRDTGCYSDDCTGYGLGLALVKEYCRLIKIKINVESQEGKGTRFILTIPLADDGE